MYETIAARGNHVFRRGNYVFDSFDAKSAPRVSIPTYDFID